MTLSELTSELFLYLVVFRRKVAGKVPQGADAVAHELELIFARMDQKAAESPELAQSFPRARKTLAIIADGVIVGSDWDNALDFRMHHLLESKFYKSNEGGDKFFEDLNLVGGEDAALREIYFTGLALGFQGRYARQPEVRMDMKKKLYLGLPQRVLDSADKLTPEVYEHIDTRDCTVPPVVRFSRYGIVLAGILLFFYLVGNAVYFQQTSEIKNRIEKILKPTEGKK